MAISFKGAHFPQEVILMGVRWYLAYPLSTCHVEELMEERGVELDHATINRWVIKYSPPHSPGLTLQRHLIALLKFAPVESRFCSCKRRGKATFDTPINPCARSACSRSVAVGIMYGFFALS